MSHATESPSSVQGQAPTFAELCQAAVAWWPTLTAEQQAGIGREQAESGMSVEEFVLSLAQFGSHAEYQGDKPSPAAAVVVQAEQAEAEQAATEERLMRDADQTCKLAVRAYRKGEAQYRDGLLRAGELSHRYLVQRMALKHPRANGVQTLVSEFARWSSSPVDAASVNRLVAVYQSYRLLAEEPGVKADVPWGTYRDGWCQLVERVQKDTPEEAWVLLPGLEAECQALFAEGCKDAWPRETVLTQVKGLLRRHADQQAAAARQKAEQQRQAEQDAAQRADAAKLATVRQQQAAYQAEQEAKAATNDATRAELTAKAESERKALSERQAAERAATQEAEQRERERARAERTAQDATKAAEKAAAQAEKAAAGKRTPRPGTVNPPTDPRPQGNLLQSAKQGTAKDVAEMCVELVTSNDDPDGVLLTMLRELKGHNCVGKQTKRAIDAALLVLSRASSPSPMQVAAVAPSSNGAVAAVA